MVLKIKSFEDCRKIYKDIIAGYSKIQTSDLGGFYQSENFNFTCYVKHLNDFELGDIEGSTDYLVEDLKKRGIPTESEILQSANENGLWTEENEQKYYEAIQSLKDLETEKKKIVSREQAEQLNEIIKDRKNGLAELILERGEFLKVSVEFFCRKKIQEKLVKQSFYSDPELKNRLFTDSEFDDLSSNHVNCLLTSFDLLYNMLGERNIKKIAASPFFLNSFCLCDNNPFIYYGKSITDLSNYQVDLFNQGKINKNILEQGGSPLEMERVDEKGIDKLVDWYDIEFSILLGKIEKNKREAEMGRR